MSLTPREFLKKWKLSPSQFGELLGIQIAQATRLLAKPNASYAQQATAAQSDRLGELNLLLELLDRSEQRKSSLAKIDRLLDSSEALERLNKIVYKKT